MIKSPGPYNLVILNIYIPNYISIKYKKQNLTELQRKIDKIYHCNGDFNTP